MDENARGVASKILCDLLNISKSDNAADVSTDNKVSNGVEGQGTGERDADDSVSEAASTASSLSPVRRGKDHISDVSTSDSEGVTSRMSLEPVKQFIEMTGNDSEGSRCIYGRDVDIVTDDSVALSSATASNKIKFNSMVNYDWELKYYRGCLIAVSSKCIAYALRGRQGYVVRLLNPETASRTLIKGFVGVISELAFSHKDSNTLACVDEGGNVYIWVVHEENGKLEYSVKLHIKRPLGTPCEYHRLIWTPYMPDIEEHGESSDSPGEEGRPLAITHDNQVEVIDIESLVESCGRAEVTIDDIRQAEGYLEIRDGHEKPITEGALSPDGSVLATASEDGHIKFWQLSENVECMHEFQPHHGSPVTCMMFTDNQTSQDKDLPMWRFLITGAQVMREVKVWCTVTWSCLQTIRFTLPDIPGPSSPTPSFLQVSLDLSASYLVVSDVMKKVLYVFMFHQDLNEGQAHVTSVAKFLLTQPLLSFVVGQVKLFKLKSHGEQNGEENGENHNEEDIHSSHVGMEEIAAGDEKGKKYGVQLQLFCIQPKAMQELLVHFQPEPSVPPPTPSTLSSLTTVTGQSVVHDALSDVSGIDTGTEASTDAEEHDDNTDGPQPVRAKLITPEAFKNSVSRGSPRPDAVSSSGSSVTMVSGLNNSQGSVDELLGSSVSSRLSDTTVRSSNSVTPHGSFHSSGILTPTSLPLPPSPTMLNSSEASAVPIPHFQSSPHGGLTQNETIPRTPVMEPLVPVTNTVTEAAAYSLLNNNSENGSKGATPRDRSGSASPVGREREIEVLVDDDTKDEGAEELPESQKPEAEIQEELNERDRKSSSGSSTSESLRPMSARATGNLINLDDNERGKGDEVQADGEDIFTDEGLLDQWEMNVEDDVIPTGRESPESAHALPVGTPVLTSNEGRRQPSALASFVSTPVTATDIPPQPVQGVSMDSSVMTSIGELLSLVKAQQKDLHDLRQQLNVLQSAQQQKMTAVAHEVQTVEERVCSRLEGSLAAFYKDESQRLDKALRDKHSADKKRHEQLQSTLSQALTTTLSGKLDKAVKAEVKSAVVPSVQKALNSLQEQLNTTLAQKLTAADTVLKDSIGKMVKSKGVVDAIGSAAASALQGPIQMTYREAFQSTILPAFERACQNMFQQINESFHKGTQQYLHQVTTALDNRRREEKDSLGPVMQQLEAQTKSFHAMTDRLSSNIMADFEVMLQKQLSSSIEGLREEIFSRLLSEVLASVQDSVQKEMGLGLEGLRQQLSKMIASSTQSTTQHAPDLANTQAIVSRLLESGQVCQAFQEALTASDLGVVMYVCETVNPDSVFSESPCPLSQPVLLSLIQQLSVDLTLNTELKHKYIEEALMALDTRDEVTREHMPVVLEGLCQQLQSAIKEASGPMHRSLRMLLMAATSLLR